MAKQNLKLNIKEVLTDKHDCSTKQSLYLNTMSRPAIQVGEDLNAL